MNLQEVADLALSYFERKSIRDKEIWVTKDNRPQWLEDLIFKAHDHMLPDDYKYQFIYDALTTISENEDKDDQFEDICNSVSDYTHELTGWLHSRTDRYSYCNEAIEENGEYQDIIKLLQDGEFKERNEVYYSVLCSLEDHIDLEDWNE